MDFNELMRVAESKQEAIQSKQVNRYNLDSKPTKREEKAKPRSDVVKRLIEEKMQEKRTREENLMKEQKRKEREERKKNQYRIPKKKSDRDSLIDSLFEDNEATDDDSLPNSNDSVLREAEKENGVFSKSHSKDSGSKNIDSHKHSNDKSSNSSHKQSNHKRSNSSHKHSSSNGRHSSSSHSKNSSSHSSSSSSSKQSKSSSSSSSDKSLSHSKSASKSKPSQDSSKLTKEQPKTLTKEQPITLTKHHLNPTIERHAEFSAQSEKEKILAKLAAIKERTRQAIQSNSRSSKVRLEKGKRRTKTNEEKLDIKSVEIVKDVDSSDEEPGKTEYNALDLMLEERKAKLEREKIARLAKQAWERANAANESSVEKSHKKKKQSRDKERLKPRIEKEKRKEHRRAHSLSDDEVVEPKLKKKAKPVIVRHATNSAPPPMDFKALLALADKKQHEPPKPIEKAIPKNKKEKEERPLTQEEKDRKERIKSKEYKDWLKYGGKCPTKKDGVSSSEDEQKNNVQKSSANNKPNIHSKDGKKVVESHKNLSKSANSRNIPVNENVLVCGPANSSEDEASTHRRKHTNPFDEIVSKFHKKKPKVPNTVNRLRIDSEEEEDSDLDGFIDDGEGDDAGYSKEIEKIFGYNKRKYRDMDEDNLSDMEADFATVMREEKRSAKLGKMEDLEDMRREEEELRQKALMKKKMKLSRR